jgi:hypothetical protein
MFNQNMFNPFNQSFNQNFNQNITVYKHISRRNPDVRTENFDLVKLSKSLSNIGWVLPNYHPDPKTNFVSIKYFFLILF